MKLLSLLALATLTTACSHAGSLSSPGEQVTLVTSLPAAEAAKMTDLGEMAVEESWPFRGDEEDAKTKMRNYAARDGANVVLLQEEGRRPCEKDAQENCVFAVGRKYRDGDGSSRPPEAL